MEFNQVLNHLRVTLENNRNVMIDLLKSFEGVKVTKPDGTFYCFADFSAYNKNSNPLSAFLIDKVQVLTVPGAEFGIGRLFKIELLRNN